MSRRWSWTPLVGAILLLFWPVGDLSITGADDEPTVWLSPNLQSRDYLAFMEMDWNAAREVQVFKFHSGNLNADTFTPNNLGEIRARDGFDRLRAQGLQLGIEVGVIKEPPDGNPDWCGGAVWKQAALKYIEAVESRPGTRAHVRWLSMDEPLVQTRTGCALPFDTIVEKTVDFIRATRAARPGIGIIDIEPYPVIPVHDIVRWLDALHSAGAPIEGLHLDINRESGIDLADPHEREKLLRLGVYLRQKGLRFGLIYWSQRTASSHAYVEDTLRFYVESSFLRPYLTDLVFQSWHPSPDGLLSVPVNLPQESAPEESHIGLIRSALNYSRTVERGIACDRPIGITERRIYYPDVDAALPSGPNLVGTGRCPPSTNGSYRDIRRFFAPSSGHRLSGRSSAPQPPWVDEGIAFRTLTAQRPGATRELFSCRVPGGFAAGLEPCPSEGGESLGWVGERPGPGTQALYLLRHPNGTRLVTIDRDEGSSSGYRPERLLGHVPLH